MKANIPQGQMFVQFPSPIAELQDTPKPRVWVKVGNESEFADGTISLFVDNNALQLYSVGRLKQLGIRDKWLISDSYYTMMVSEGKFVPIEDLNEVESVCKERGCELPMEAEW